MANALYEKARERFLNGSLNWGTDTVVASLVNGSYAVDLVSHQYGTDLGSNLTGYAQTALTGKTTVSGAADANDVVWVSGSMASLEPAGGIVLYKDTGTFASSPLIAYIDTLDSLPFTWDGASDVTMAWSNGTNKIFAL